MYTNTTLFTFQVPLQYNFIQVMDLFFKVHKIFDLDFNKSIKPMMVFLEYFIYKIRETGHYLTPRIREVADKIFGKT